MRVSVDSFDPAEIRTAVAAGAELVLSVNGSNLDVARELAGTRRAGGGDSRLRRGRSTRWSRRSTRSSAGACGYLIDPIIEPIGFGFMASLERYAEVRRRYPECRADDGRRQHHRAHQRRHDRRERAAASRSAQELGVRAVLTTEVIPWARGAVREIDIARRLMHHAVTPADHPQGRGRPAASR